MKKKVILTFLSLTLVMTMVLAGCTEPEEPAVSTAPAATQEPAAPAATEEPAAPTTPAATEEPAAPQETYKLRFSSHYPADRTEPWANAIAEATGGRVEIVIYANSSLLDLQDTLDGLEDGMCDIAYIKPETFAEAFPLHGALIMPFLPLGDQRQQYELWYALMDEIPELAAEWDRVQIIEDDTLTGNVLHMVDFAATVPEDMDGLRVFAGAATADIMEDLGATPLYLEVPDWFTSLDRGLLDAMWLPWDATWQLKIYPLLPYHTPFTGYEGMLMKATAMNKDTWNSLPADIQKILLESGVAERERQWTSLDEKTQLAIDTILAEGGTIVELTPEQINLWYEAAQPVHQEYLAKVDAMGLPATEVYNKAIEMAKEFTAE